MAPSPAKRTKVAHQSPSSGTASAGGGGQANLRDLFARNSAAAQYSPENASIERDSRQREEDELRWAIRESLREAERVQKTATAAEAATKDVESVQQHKRPELQPLQQQDDNVQHARSSKAVLLADDAELLPASSHYETSRQAQECPSSEASSCTLQSNPNSKAEPAGPSFNAFSKLMSTHSEAKEWATADAVEKRNYTGVARNRVQHRTAPFYKVLTGMPISVDAFRFGEIQGCTAYFLSHFHADHYGGLTSSWTHGPIYCSITTANLVRSSLRVQDFHVCPLPMNVPIEIPRTGGVRVTLLDANHCPGSCLFFFEGPQTCHILPTQTGYSHPALAPPSMTCRYLHCGDFRASPRHVNHPAIKGKRIDTIYLDTTYCNPRYCFPAQEQVVNACAQMLYRVVPEQCRRGQMACAARDMKQEAQEDWRTSPLKGRKLEAAIKAEEDAKGANVLRSWLDGTAASSSSSSRIPLSEEALRSETEKVKEEEPEEDLSGLDFEDEEMGFKRGVMEFDASDGSVTEHWRQEEGEINDDESPGEKDDAEGMALVKIEADTTQDDDAKAEDELVLDQTSGLGRFKTPEPKAKREPDNERKELLDVINEDYPRVLVVVGTYTIGKEKIVMACARALGTRVFCADPRKYRVYAQLEDAELHSLLTRNPHEAYVHVTSLMSINGDALKEHASKMRSQGMRIDRAIAFRPTGWTYRPPAGMDVISPSLERLIQWNQRRTFSSSFMFTTRDSTHDYSIYGVPYSEHSSFFELTAFCLSVDYGRIIATVNVGNAQSRAKMARWFEKWKAEKKRRNGVPVEPRSADYF